MFFFASRKATSVPNHFLPDLKCPTQGLQGTTLVLSKLSAFLDVT